MRANGGVAVCQHLLQLRNNLIALADCSDERLDDLHILGAVALVQDGLDVSGPADIHRAGKVVGYARFRSAFLALAEDHDCVVPVIVDAPRGEALHELRGDALALRPIHQAQAAIRVEAPAIAGMAVIPAVRRRADIDIATILDDAQRFQETQPEHAVVFVTRRADDGGEAAIRKRQDVRIGQDDVDPGTLRHGRRRHNRHRPARRCAGCR